MHLPFGRRPRLLDWHTLAHRCIISLQECNHYLKPKCGPPGSSTNAPLSSSLPTDYNPREVGPSASPMSALPTRAKADVPQEIWQPLMGRNRLASTAHDLGWI